MFRQSISVFYHINAASYQVPSHPDCKFRVYFWHWSGISLFEGYSNTHKLKVFAGLIKSIIYMFSRKQVWSCGICLARHRSPVPSWLSSGTL